MLNLLGKVIGVLPLLLHLPWVQKVQQFVFKDLLSEDRERERGEGGRERERSRIIGVKAVFCILICEHVIRITETWQQSKPNVCYDSSSSSPPLPPRLILVIHRLVSLLLFFCSPFFVSYLCPFLGAFAKLRTATNDVVMSFCLSVCPHGTTRLPLDGFTWNLIFEDFKNICP